MGNGRLGGKGKRNPAFGIWADRADNELPNLRCYAARNASAQHQSGEESLFAAVGRLIGVELRSDVDLLRLQREGMPMDAFERLAEYLPADGIKVIASRSGLRRRRAVGFLSPSESERALRVARVLARAIELFDSEQQAQEWLARPADYVSGEDVISPLAPCAHEAGARIIKNRLIRTRFGMF